MIDALELLVLLANLGLVGGQVPRQVLSMMFCFSERLVGEEQRQFQSSVDLPIFTVVFFHVFFQCFSSISTSVVGDIHMPGICSSPVDLSSFEGFGGQQQRQQNAQCGRRTAVMRV